MLDVIDIVLAALHSQHGGQLGLDHKSPLPNAPQIMLLETCENTESLILI